MRRHQRRGRRIAAEILELRRPRRRRRERLVLVARPGCSRRVRSTGRRAGVQKAKERPLFEGLSPGGGAL